MTGLDKAAVRPLDTAPQGPDAMEPQTVDVHEGAWALVIGTNGKPAGWIDTHELFAHQLYRDQILPSTEAPAPPEATAGELVEPVAWACVKCNAPRSVDPCPKCGTPLTKPTDGWEWPTLPDISRIRELAREVGYAVGVHGSLERDLDLIAVPWVAEAVAPLALAQYIAAGFPGGEVLAFESQDKPCGRWTCNIHMHGWKKMIDLSIMPSLTPLEQNLAAAIDLVEAVNDEHTRTAARMEAAEAALSTALRDLDGVRGEDERKTKALEKINAIRNSIIGLQTMNWSEHIYPLVAALNEAGIEGMSYDEARPYFGTMLERTNAADARSEALARNLEAAVEALKTLANNYAIIGVSAGLSDGEIAKALSRPRALLARLDGKGGTTS